MAITIDITKAKNIWKDKIRFNRSKVLKKLDVDFIKHKKLEQAQQLLLQTNKL
jgi:hypothetical protein